MSFFCHQIEVDFVHIAGVIVEYDPMHLGHVHLLRSIRRALGEDTAVVLAMSGDFVQRGGFAVVGRRARAAAAVRSGADLVLEVPVLWAVASAERFAEGGVQVLLGTGLVDHLAFGSECGDGKLLMETARELCAPAFAPVLRQELSAGGGTYASAYQRAARQVLGPERAAILDHPNDLLGLEYCKALARRNSAVDIFTVRRVLAPHNAPQAQAAAASATAIRALLRRGEREAALGAMAPAMAAAYEEEERLGRAPVLMERCERAILAQLRRMDAEDFAALDGGKEGLGNRLYAASRASSSVEALLDAAKTRRYPHARLRRMVLWAYLGIGQSGMMESVPYLRVLAANAVGRTLLARMRKTAALPILTKPADVRRLGGEARSLFALEARCADLYALAYPDLAAAAGGRLWREGPVIL